MQRAEVLHAVSGAAVQLKRQLYTRRLERASQLVLGLHFPVLQYMFAECNFAIMCCPVCLCLTVKIHHNNFQEAVLQAEQVSLTQP